MYGANTQRVSGVVIVAPRVPSKMQVQSGAESVETTAEHGVRGRMPNYRMYKSIRGTIAQSGGGWALEGAWGCRTISRSTGKLAR